ncbi:MAG TPA: permease [Acidimicrobiales bacterium]|nr:permease [Acidimicrobiales bacterium]
MSAAAGAAWDVVSTTVSLLWMAAWALVLGYAFSSAIQVFVKPAEAADRLGGGGVGDVGRAAGLGFISSSCSFAALAATRTLWVKGARLESALAFMFASTNLVIELGVLLWIFLGWEFVVALYLGAAILIPVMVVLVRLTYPERLGEEARRRAGEVQGSEADPAEGLDASWRERLRDRRAWSRVGDRFVAEWRMAGREIAFGFLVAGAIAALVPREAFETAFPGVGPQWLQAVLHAVIAPVAAVVTFIGSMGNGPLAALLWENGVAFAGIMAFLAADFVVPPSLKINANYYGWRFSLYLAAVFTAAAVISGVALHALFALVGLTPDRDVRLAERASFGVDHTFFLNLVALAVAAVLLGLRRARAAGGRAGGPHRPNTRAAKRQEA